MVKLFSSRPLRFRAGFSLPHPNYFGEKIRSSYLSPTVTTKSPTNLIWN